MMIPEYTDEQKWWCVDGTEGVFMFEEHGYTKEEAIQQYHGTPFEVECVFGVGVRLTMPGFLDCTEWDVFDTKKEAREYVLNHWERDPDTGDWLDG